MAKKQRKKQDASRTISHGVLMCFYIPMSKFFSFFFAFYQRKKTLLIFEANTDLPSRLRVLALLEFFGHIIDGNIMGIVGYNMFEW